MKMIHRSSSTIMGQRQIACTNNKNNNYPPSFLIEQYGLLVGGEHVQEDGLHAVVVRRARRRARQLPDEHVQQHGCYAGAPE